MSLPAWTSYAVELVRTPVPLTLPPWRLSPLMVLAKVPSDTPPVLTTSFAPLNSLANVSVSVTPEPMTIVAPLKALASPGVSASVPPVKMLIVSPLNALAAVTFRVSPLPMLMVAPAPKVLATVAVRVPPLTLTVPAKGLAPVKVRLSAPCLVRVPAPAANEPEKAKSVASPMASVPPPNVTLPPTEPPPVSSVKVWLKPFRFSLAPALFASVTARSRSAGRC